MNQQLIFDLAVKHKHICGELPLNVVEELTLVGLERFAEVIVKRIIDNVECHADMYDAPDTRFICEKIVNSIKFDFGVEE